VPRITGPRRGSMPMNLRFSSFSGLLAIVALPGMCVARPVFAQVDQVHQHGLTPLAVEASNPAQRSDAQNRCIGSAITGGLIVAVGSFLGIKLLNSAPFADSSPPSDGVVLAISVVAGTGYVIWKSRTCDQEYRVIPGVTLPRAHRLPGFTRKPVRFDPFAAGSAPGNPVR
jgi:hypothetical protein